MQRSEGLTIALAESGAAHNGIDPQSGDFGRASGRIRNHGGKIAYGQEPPLNPFSGIRHSPLLLIPTAAAVRRDEQQSAGACLACIGRLEKHDYAASRATRQLLADRKDWVHDSLLA